MWSCHLDLYSGSFDPPSCLKSETETQKTRVWVVSSSWSWWSGTGRVGAGISEWHYLLFVPTNSHTHIHICRVSQEECARLRESVPYVKLYRYNPKHLCPTLNGYGDNGQRKVWASLVSTYCTPSVTSYLSNAPARQLDMVMQWPWCVRYSAR